MRPNFTDKHTVRRLEKACQFVMHYCTGVQRDWTLLAQLQEKLPEMACTMNKAMLAVMMIPTKDNDGETR